MEDRLKQIFARLFGVEVNAVTPESSPQTIKKWDSLAHMNLVVSIEEEFGVEFSDDEIPRLVDFRTIEAMTAGKMK